MLDILKDKITKNLYSTLTYCVQYNVAAQEVGRATGEDYKILYARLKQKIQKNSEVENEKLQTEFEQLKPRSKETPVSTTVELAPSQQNSGTCYRYM